MIEMWKDSPLLVIVVILISIIVSSWSVELLDVKQVHAAPAATSTERSLERMAKAEEKQADEVEKIRRLLEKRFR